jgi:hypothetical protein
MTTRAQKIRERTIKVVVSPLTGIDYEITKIMFEDLIAELGEIPLDLFGMSPNEAVDEATSEEHQREQMRFVFQNIHKIKEFYRAVLKLGCLDPRVVEDVRDPDHEITPSMLGEDYQWLINEIMEYSGYVGKEPQPSDALPKANSEELSGTPPNGLA